MSDSDYSTVSVIFPHHYSTTYASQLQAMRERFPTLDLHLDGVDRVSVISDSLTDEVREIHAWIEWHFRERTGLE